MHNMLFTDPILGRVAAPKILTSSISYAGKAVRPMARRGEIGVVVAYQRRPIYAAPGVIERMETIWSSITHNERVDKGASLEAQQCYAAGSSPAAPSATVYPSVIALASAALTKTKTDLSLGSATAGVTTNEYTTIGLSRAAVTAPAAGDYTAPGSLGGTFTQNLKKTFTASGSGTVYGAGLFDSTTVASSNLWYEDNFASNAVMVSGDTVAVTWTISN